MPADLVHELILLWESSDSPPDVLAFLQRHPGVAAPEKVRVLLADQPRRWRTSAPLRVEDYLAHLPELASDPEIKLQLVVGEFQTRHGSDTAPSVEEYASRFPDLGDSLSGKLLDVLDPYRTSAVPVQAQRIGRYRSLRLLGEGAFGRVWLAFDDELQRQVAIKVPKAERFQRPEDAEAYLAEARTVAGLDHPHIVPVYDVGRTADGSIYVVSRFIEGRNLAERIGENRPSPEDSAALLSKVAAALHHAHQKHLIHRDIKPANILIEDRTGAPFVADFGLAITEENSLGDTRLAGTPAYMSPEQARGEGHRLDGRSDIFALGVVFYELLTGKRPFRGSTHNELLHQVITTDPKPPRELAGSIPAELERICLKALSKRASDRYATAAEMADDLAHWRQGAELPQTDLQIVPKGLRSFDAGDADFFLQLLPGPRNRTGLPESLQFWKSRLEETDPEQTFSVGLIYGPSGCGKSSLMKAGLLPRISKEVLAVYVEATPDDTETRILRGVRKLVPELGENLGLAETFAFLRRRAGKKVVVVLDQFEQWLHAHRTEQETELVAALRQCDGGQVQAVVMVRDDFWLAASRFMSDVEVELVQGHNLALVDLFDVDHAQKVLCKFGQAYGKLPQQWEKASPEEQRFVEAVTNGLAQDGKVVSVRLALFAEMVKGKPWTPATLAEVGGTEGIGVNFLEETFASRTANPKHRLHQEAARSVLKALLPEVGADIKGHMRSHGELLAAAGYQARPQEFHELLRMLDGELRLITPTDPEGAQSATGSDPNSKFYQLTHDYLVPSLRDWLTRKQKETAKGRAELLLADRAAVWNARPENQQLPSLLEWGRILWLTDRKSWSLAQTKMMRQARRYHLLRGAAACAAVVLLLVAGLWVRGRVAEQQEATRVEGLVGRLVSAEPNQLPEIVRELDATPQLADRFLAPLLAAKEATPEAKRAQLHARLARVSREPALIDPLAEELLTGPLAYVLPIRRQLRPFAVELREKYGKLLHDEQAGPERRFRAALVLAEYLPEAEAGFWSETDLSFVANQLVSANAEFQPLLREALRPIRAKLLGELEDVFSASAATDAQRLSAANAFADYASGDVGKLTELLTVATPEQHAVLFPLVKSSPSPATVEKLAGIAATLPPEELGSVERIPFGQRRANAAVTLLQLGEREKVLPVFNLTDDPEPLTQFIFRCRPRGVGAEPLLDCLQQVSVAPQGRYPQQARYALLLALGEFKVEEIPETRREAVLKQLADWYRDDPSSGVHGAAGWLLRQWGQAETASKVDQTPVAYSPDREWFTVAIQVKAKSKSLLGQFLGSTAKQTFYYTFVVFSAGEYTIGSVSDELKRSERKGHEQRHGVQLTRTFALLDREVTQAELIAFAPNYSIQMERFSRKPVDAGFAVDWYDSVSFCRWLSEQEGLPEVDQAYADPESLPKEEYPREPDPAAKWAPRDWPVDLRRRGYRLPTEAEWEVASRAGARTTYGYGSDVRLLGHFGWFVDNSGHHVHPPRELRPSVRGLFDMQGNVFEWTHDWGSDFGSAKVTDPLTSKGGVSRVARGGGGGQGAELCRAANRFTVMPSLRAGDLGFRLALSLSGVTSPAEQGKETEAKPGGGGTEGAKAEPRPEMP